MRNLFPTSSFCTRSRNRASAIVPCLTGLTGNLRTLHLRIAAIIATTACVLPLCGTGAMASGLHSFWPATIFTCSLSDTLTWGLNGQKNENEQEHKQQLRPDPGRDHSAAGFRKSQWLLLPIVFRSPDTGFAAGVLPQVVYRRAPDRHPSSIRMDAYYTQKSQYHLLLRSTLWLNDDRTGVNIRFSFKKWPTNYYGTGNNTFEIEPDPFTDRIREFETDATQHLGGGVYAGAGYRLRLGRVEPDMADGPLVTGSVTGTGRSAVSGMGALLRYDTRNHHYFPTRGSWHLLEIYRADRMLGSDFGYTRLTLDMRRYLPLGQDQVIALQGVFTMTSGDVPFRVLPSAGAVLRGYPEVRHIAGNVVAFQAEYRWVPVAGRFGFTVFAGAGDVYDHTGDLRWNRIKYTVGVGIRYLFSRSEKINIRLDYGIGRESSGDYLDLTEDF